ncbi:nuclear transport factor 2 family protein [Kocuria tytonis]|uniref:Nuclear transport factor 2 family protein n=1 Tax=Kocuria tytonis TaxID=2054280 RepID=A0A495AAK0_9MICC|nr:nuclear transport factor 2 family protein [Kocuria tytonis]RKQ37056.1 nuclear transport factor 2 family protein [Kocuria tytonis]
MTVKQSEIDRVLELECDLQSRSTRGDVARLRELLAPDFVEIGASGGQWDLETILGLLSRESSAPDSAEIEISGLSARTLSLDVVQVFWESRRGEQRARRTSLWRRSGGDWQQIYHQGTPLT